MQFSEEMQRVYHQGFEVAVKSAGYQPMLISNKEHANKIDDEIIAEIRRSAFLVADFTGHRQNVYFETRFAIGLGLQVVWTYKKNEIAALHFDIRQYNCIAWRTGPISRRDSSTESKRCLVKGRLQHDRQASVHSPIGFEPTREGAMTAFAKSSRRE
jgi:hypothetical protein